MTKAEHLFDTYQLPDQQNRFLADWDVVLIPEEKKNLLISYVSTLRRLSAVESAGLALRRGVLLYGPPGCGKTSLARGLPAQWSLLTRGSRTGFVHVNTHALFSGVRGEGQKNVLMTFERIAELASSRLPIFVLIDEVETLGSDRASISMETNPLDALYQVTAFLESLDRCARELPNVTFIFTTNIPKAIDRAVRERVDFVLEIPTPDSTYRSLILIDAIKTMAPVFEVSDLLALAKANPSEPGWVKVIDAADGLSGRALRHVLVIAATLAGNSPVLRLNHLYGAVNMVAETEENLRQNRGMYIESYQDAGTPATRPGPDRVTASRPEPDQRSGANGTFAPASLGPALLDEMQETHAAVAELRDMIQEWNQPNREPAAHARKGWFRRIRQGGDANPGQRPTEG